jgi:hypothetical protein
MINILKLIILKLFYIKFNNLNLFYEILYKFKNTNYKVKKSLIKLLKYIYFMILSNYRR